jgi:hypothetical protein
MENSTEKITLNYDYPSLKNSTLQRDRKDNVDKIHSLLEKEINGSSSKPDESFTRLLLESAAHPILLLMLILLLNMSIQPWKI